MFKRAKNIFWCLGLLSLGLALVSCKSKKTAVADSSKPADQIGESREATELRFGSLYISGCAERMKGNLKEALVFFLDCKKINPNNAALNFELGTVYKLLKSNNEALPYAKAAAEAEPKNEWYQLLLIDCYNQNKQFSQAIKVRENLVKNFPNRSEFKEDLAVDYAITGQFERSFKIFDELEKTYGVNEQLTLNKIKLLKGQKKHKEVLAELTKLSNTNKNETRFYAYLAEFYMEQAEPENAKAMYDKIILLEPKNPTINLALHDYYEMKRMRGEAYDHLKKAFENPDLEIGIKSSILGDYYKQAEMRNAEALEKGSELAKIMLGAHPKATEANAFYGDFLRLQHKPREAQQYYYTAAINEKRDYRVWENLLYTDNELGRFDSLERHSATAIELFPNHPANYLYNGVANARLKDYKKAVVSLRDGLSLVNDNKALMLDFLSALGDAYFNLKDHARSDKAFEDALKIDADNTYVLNNYAYYLSLRNENLNKAEKLSKRTLELREGDRNYMDTYGWILYQQKRYKEAAEWLGKAAAIGPKNANILEHYGDALYRLNRKEEALMQWNQAKEAGGDSPELSKKIKEKKLND